MSYRQHNFDPNATQRPASPARPYDWVQWLGVALGSAGVLLSLADFAARFGWVDDRFEAGTGVIVALCATGVILINSRREPAHDLAPELAAQRKRWLIVATIVIVAILGAAALVEFTGA